MLGIGERTDNESTEALSYRAIVNFVDQLIWSTTPSGFHDYYNERWYEFTGVSEGSTDGDGWNDMFHPEDRERAWIAWRNALETGDPYAIEYRLRHHSGEYRWVLGRAQCVRDQAGRILRWYGSCTDIHETRKAMELNDVLSRELSHRIKNIFAVISSLIAMSARSMPQTKAFADQIRGRIAALGRAHEFVRPHSDDSRPNIDATTLKGILASLLAAYPTSDSGAITVRGDDVPVDDKGATPLALLFHELATNAVKYGALSNPGGKVDIEIATTTDSVEMNWTEKGGPLLNSAPEATGFGTRMANISAENQLGGSLVRDWNREGMRAHIKIPRDSLWRTF